MVVRLQRNQLSSLSDGHFNGELYFPNFARSNKAKNYQFYTRLRARSSNTTHTLSFSFSSSTMRSQKKVKPFLGAEY